MTSCVRSCNPVRVLIFIPFVRRLDDFLGPPSSVIPSQFAGQQHQFLAPNRQYRVTPPDVSSTPTPPPRSPSEYDAGGGHTTTAATFERSSVRSVTVPSRPRTLVGPGVPSSPLSPTAARPSSFQDMRTLGQRASGASLSSSSSTMNAAADFSTATRSAARSWTPQSQAMAPEIAVPQPAYPLQRPQIELERPLPQQTHENDQGTAGFSLTRAVAVAALEAQERVGSAAGTSSSLPVPGGEARQGTSQRTSPKRHKAAPKDEEESIEKERPSHGKGDSPKRKPRTSAGRKRSGDNVRGQSSGSGSPAQQAINRQIQQLSIDIPSSFAGQTSGFLSPGPSSSPTHTRLSPSGGLGQHGVGVASSSATRRESGVGSATVSPSASNIREEPRDEDEDAMDEDTDEGVSPADSKTTSKGKGKATANWDGDDKDYEFSIGGTPPRGDREKREKISIACSFCRSKLSFCLFIRISRV
ncbi:hypothetical protein SCHPADRAFT_388049 [Schizopora paradoxa]|uniref:Uncharacterized protein n=1 Tax=Schizopora paradoxa TaxID=27342 RepID=A0A0H2RM86_9AGAM|nr:hypothetical protein SCHPADRAFT_388049 [Schizopora paradoxa]